LIVLIGSAGRVVGRIPNSNHGDALSATAPAYAVLAAPLPNAACAAASRAIGTRNGEHET
jgi:hypothetical protein